MLCMAAGVSTFTLDEHVAPSMALIVCFIPELSSVLPGLVPGSDDWRVAAREFSVAEADARSRRAVAPPPTEAAGRNAT